MALEMAHTVYKRIETQSKRHLKRTRQLHKKYRMDKISMAEFNKLPPEVLQEFYEERSRHMALDEVLKLMETWGLKPLPDCINQKVAQK